MSFVCVRTLTILPILRSRELFFGNVFLVIPPTLFLFFPISPGCVVKGFYFVLAFFLKRKEPVLFY